MLLKPGETVELRPEGEGKDPVYRLRAPLLYDRVQLEAAVTRHGGKRHGAYELLAALRADVVTAMADSDDAEQREALLARSARAGPPSASG